jgi:dipeptidyl aminopeptidase/acylaminoacyl peptidase
MKLFVSPLKRFLYSAALVLCLSAATLIQADVIPPKAVTSKVQAAKTLELTLDRIAPAQGLFRPSPQYPRFSFDGKYAAFLLGNDLMVRDNASGKLDRSATPAGQSVRFFTWSPTANELLLETASWPPTDKERRPETAVLRLYRWQVGQKQPLLMSKTPDQDARAQYLPDGEGYTFVRNKNILMRHQFEDPQPARLFTLPAGENLGWYQVSPDGQRLAVETWKWAPGAKPERTVLLPDFSSRFLTFRSWVRPLAEDGKAGSQATLYQYDLSSTEGTLVRIHKHTLAQFGDSLSLPSWSPDSDKLTFATFQASSGMVRLLVADLSAEEEAVQVVHRFVHKGGPETPRMIQPLFLGDSQRLVFLSEESGFRHLQVFDPEKGTAQPLTSGSFEVYLFDLSKDRQFLYVASTKEATPCQDLYRVSVDSGKMERLTRERGVYRDASVSPDGKTMLATFVHFGGTPELVRLDRATGSQQTVLNNQPLTTRTMVLVRPEFFTCENRHGDTIHGYLFKPAGATAKDKRPALIYTYGGPLGFAKEVQEGNYRTDAYFFARYMTEKHGYVTVVIDTRGMSGYGGEFEKANFDQPGKPAVEDLEDGVKYLVKNHGVDPSRVALHGWSFGGYVTQLAMYTRPKLFAAGIAVAGPTEWENYYGSYTQMVISKKDLKQFSLLQFAKNLEGRLLLLHGAKDDRVLFQDTVRILQELRKQGKELLVESRFDWTGGHGMNSDLKERDRLRIYEDFLLRTLGRGTSPQSESKMAKAA